MPQTDLVLNKNRRTVLRKLIPILILLLLWLLSSCMPRSGVIVVGAEAVGDMPPEAHDVDTYIVEISVVVDSLHLHNPRSTIGANDSLNFWFDYKTPDPDITYVYDILPSGRLYATPFANTDAIWTEDNDAGLFEKWTTLAPGPYQGFVIAVNSVGETRSARYDFMVTGTAPIEVIVRGILTK